MSDTATFPLPRVLVRLVAVTGLTLLTPGCMPSSGESAGLRANAPEEGADVAALPEATSGLGGYLAGRHARSHHDTAAAQVYFTRALDDEPTDPNLLSAALASALAERDMAAAASLANRLHAVAPDIGVVRVTLATIALIGGDNAAASETLDGLSATALGGFARPLLRAWALFGQGDASAALAALRPLAARAAFAGAHDYHAGLIADLAGRTETAETAFTGALSAERGGGLRVVLAAGSFYRRQGRDNNARAIYDTFLDENPDTTFLDPVYRSLDTGAEAPRPVADAGDGYAEALYAIASALFADKAIEAARIYAQLCLAARAGHDACRMLLGDIYADVERYAEAAAAYGAVDEASPLKWALRLRAANMLAELERIDDAARLFRTMAREHPERPDPLIALADMMLNEERYTEAVAAYNEALARIPTLENRHWSLLYARGISFERSREWESAEDDFLRALELELDQPLVLNYLGYSWVEMGRHYDRALGMIEKAVAQRPNDGFIVDSLGWVWYRLGDYERATEYLERAVALRPGDPVILDHFGDGLWRVGRHNEAQFQWRRALTFEPEPDLEETLVDKIENGLPPEPVESPVATRDL